jgi:hypothetical protein
MHPTIHLRCGTAFGIVRTFFEHREHTNIYPREMSDQEKEYNGYDKEHSTTTILKRHRRHVGDTI